MSTDSWNCHFDVTFKSQGLCENLNLWFSPNQTQTYKLVVKASSLERQFLPGLTSVIQIQWGLSGVLWLGVMAGCRMLSMDVPPQNINFIWCLNGRGLNFLKIVDHPVHTLLSLIDLMDTGVCIWQHSDIADDQNCCFSNNLSNSNGNVLSRGKFPSNGVVWSVLASWGSSWSHPSPFVPLQYNIESDASNWH